MADDRFDTLTKSVGKAVTRRDTLRAFLTILGGAALTLVGAKRASADPRTCVTCVCGVGRPCNAKGSTCAEVGQQFPTVEDACSDACERSGFKFCGAGSQFHCPRGCPA
jgi:hypothetical protein